MRDIIAKAETYENAAEKIAYRRQAFRALAYEGRASHNDALLKESGKTLADLVPSRRIGKVTRHYKKCPNCLGLFKRLRRHKCPKKKQGQTPAQLMEQATNLSAAELLPPDFEISKVLMGILSTLRDGDVKTLICKDRLLLHYADNEAKKHIMVNEESSTEDEEESAESRQARRQQRAQRKKTLTYKLRYESRVATICKQLRLLARFVIKLRKKYNKMELSMVDAFSTEYVRYTSQAICRISHDFTKVALAKKLATWIGITFIKSTMHIVDLIKVNVYLFVLPRACVRPCRYKQFRMPRDDGDKGAIERPIRSCHFANGH